MTDQVAAMIFESHLQLFHFLLQLEDFRKPGPFAEENVQLAPIDLLDVVELPHGVDLFLQFVTLQLMLILHHVRLSLDQLRHFAFQERPLLPELRLELLLF